MENEVTFLTPEGKKALEEKLIYLKTVKRLEVQKRIGIARDFGDLSENAEYDAAKEEQAHLESEIAEIDAKLRNVKIITKSSIDTSKVSVGCLVNLEDLEFKEKLSYKIVGSTETDPKKGLISNESPVGKAIMGRKKGEVVVVKTAFGESKYKILAIKC